jgi:hypothetical protein
MKIGSIGLALLLVPLAAQAQNSSEGRADKPQRGSSPTPMDANHAAATSQRGSRGSTAGGSERTGAPGGGVESGDANGMAGGRTDEGPRGGTGIPDGAHPQKERARARANSQARARNHKGSLARPADSPPDVNLNPTPIGSGAPNIPVEQQPQPQGRYYPAGPQQGQAGGVASGTEDAEGAAGPRGPAGKGAEAQPSKEPSAGAGNHNEEQTPH